MTTTTIPFKFEIPLEVFEKSEAEGGKGRRIGGIVSTDDLDRQDETVIQEGMDFQPFLDHGWFNDNHGRGIDAVVGYPEVAELRQLGKSKGWYVEGYLLDGVQKAEEIWTRANALQKTGRRLGFSVEGDVVERDPENPKQVRKAIVRNVAITHCPVNTNTSLDILAKSLSAGSAVANPGTAPGEGFPLRTESLEGGDDEEEEKRKRKHKQRKLSKAEAIRFIQRLNPRYTYEAAEAIVEYAMRHYPAA